MRRHGPDLDKAETQPQHRIGHFGILVEAGGEPDRVGKVAAPEPGRQAGIVDDRPARRPAGGECPDGQPMRPFRRQEPQQRQRERGEGGHAAALTEARKAMHAVRSERQIMDPKDLARK